MNPSIRVLCGLLLPWGCGASPPSTLGDAQELVVRAVRAGIDAKESAKPSSSGQGFREGGGEGWTGPCNCRVILSYRATPEDQIVNVHFGLFECRKGVALDRVFAVLDPVFRREDDRAAFHALLASPPKVDGADPTASISATRAFSATVVHGTWEPVVWKDLPLENAEDRAFAEETVMLWIQPRTKDNDTEETTASDLNFSSNVPKPSRCRDGSARPWERR